MADNIKTIQLRLGTVNQVSKITKAMNLVAMSKIQKFQRNIKELSEITKDFDRFETETFEETANAPTMAICIASDLGLAALYNRTLINEVKELNPDYIYWIGKQSYDRLRKDDSVNVVNQIMTSDHLYLEDFYDKVLSLMEDYRIKIAVPRMSGNEVAVTWRSLSQRLRQTDLIVYEPDYATANQRYQEFYLYMTIYEAYYNSKFSENMVRRIAMETATDNANEMREHLRNRFNQLRQEEITQEILELSAGVE